MFNNVLCLASQETIGVASSATAGIGDNSTEIGKRDPMKSANVIPC